jgi:hypothetical protein
VVVLVVAFILVLVLVVVLVLDLFFGRVQRIGLPAEISRLVVPALSQVSRTFSRTTRVGTMRNGSSGQFPGLACCPVA